MRMTFSCIEDFMCILTVIGNQKPVHGISEWFCVTFLGNRIAQNKDML